MPVVMLLLVFISSLAQAAPSLTVQTLDYQGQLAFGHTAEAGQVTMPFVTGGDPGVAASINEQLFQGQFSAAAPVPADGHFTLAETDALSSTASQSFAVTRNDERVLSIAFDSEGCGAYCENYSTYYSFDVKTGQQLAPEAIFTAEGLRTLEHRLEREKRAAHQRQLVELRAQLREAYSQNHADAVSDLNERISMNSECSGEGKHTDRTPRAVETEQALQGFGYDKYEFGEKTFRLTRERCSNHAMRALDDVGDYTLELAYGELSPWLTDEGRRLLLGKTVAPVKGKAVASTESAGEEPVLFFPSPMEGTEGLVWSVGGDPVPAGDGWWVLACEKDCALHAASLQVSESSHEATHNDEDEPPFPARKLQWSPVPAGKIIAMIKPVDAKHTVQMKAGTVKTFLHAGMEGYPEGRTGTIEISIPLGDGTSAMLVPRVASAGAEQIDRLELRAYGKRQSLPGLTLPADGALNNPKQWLVWAGDLDGDGKLDLILNHDSNGVDAAVYLSSLAQPGELVGLAGSMRYEMEGGDGC